MTVQELMNQGSYKIISEGENTKREIEDIFCCDLLSIAMSKAPAGSAWVTVMANINTLAVASLTDVGCIILAEGVSLDDETKAKAIAQGITVMSTNQSVYHTARQIDDWLHEAN